MQIHSLKAQDFRNFTYVDVDFHPQGNLILGNNAQGKSSLLEIMYLGMTGGSFRTSHLTQLIRQSTPYFFLEVIFSKLDVSHSHRIYYEKEKKMVWCNETKSSFLTSVLGGIQGVLISPEDEELIKGGPSYRRKFLDLMIAQTDPLYLRYLCRYHRAMKQRNVLLKTKQDHLLFTFEQQMAEVAPYIVSKRSELILRMQSHCRFYQNLFSQGEVFELVYQPHKEVTTASEWLDIWKESREKEKKIGCTLHGPQKDDFEFMINGKSAKFFGSQGQQRCCLASLRLSQWEDLKEQSQEIPLLLLDDFGIHLDSKRSGILLDIIQQSGAQWFLTAARDLDIKIKTQAHTIYIHNGGIVAP